MTRVRVYGPVRGHGSWPRVAQGLAEGLRACGRFGGFVAIDEVGHELDDALPDGFDAEVGIHVGPPPLASIMRGRGEHRHRLALIAVNSTFVPVAAMAALERDGQITGYVAPSRWAQGVLQGHTPRPVYLWQHGVSRALADVPPWSGPPRENYRVLHLASTHAARKGTAELIAAWGQLVGDGTLPPDSRLRLVCDGPRGFFGEAIARASASQALAVERIASTFEVSPRLDLPYEGTARLYRAHDLVVQPSRGEGFGLVPLEARAVGIPVAMTGCTGHAEHGAGGSVLIGTGALEPIDDGPDALAPSLTAAAVARALTEAYRTRGDLALAAVERASWIMERWSWEAVTRRFVSRYEGELR